MDEEKTLKKWFEEKSEQAKLKVQAATDWCKRNKEAVIVFGPVILGSLVEIAKISTKHHMVNEEKALKDRYIYDRSSGHYYELRRKPKNSEWIQIEQRKQNGESLGMILNDMRLLK